MKLKTEIVVTVLVGLVIAVSIGCSGGSATPVPDGVVLTTPVPNPTSTPEPIITSFEGDVQQFEVNLAINGSPQQGNAVFTRRGDTSHVEIRLSPGVPAQTVTLRRGQCPSPEGFEDSLDDAIGGILRQELRDYSMEDLTAGDLTLVVSVDDNSFNSFAACADLPEVD